MVKVAGYKGLIRQLSLALFILLALYLVLVRPLSQQGLNMLQSQIDELAIDLEKYLPRQDEAVLPTEQAARAQKAYIAQSEENYQTLASFLDPRKAYVPREIQEAGLYFIEQLHITTKRLRRQANVLKINIPESFGFNEEVPGNAQDVEVLLKELDVVDRVTTLLLEGGVKEVSLIKPLSPIEKRDAQTQKLFYRELPLQLSFLCNSAALTKFLYQMKNFSPVLMTKDIIVKKQEGATLQVEMLLSRLVI